MISATATTSTVASRWRRKARPAVLKTLLRGGAEPGGWLGLSVLLSTASLTLLIRPLRPSYAVPASEEGTREGSARPLKSSLTPCPGPRHERAVRQTAGSPPRYTGRAHLPSGTGVRCWWWPARSG